MNPEVKKIFDAVCSLREGMHFELNGSTYQDLVWHDQRDVAPTEEEVNAEITRLEGLVYRKLRAVEYPPVTEQLDALWKGGEAAAEMLAQIQAVKNKYPKPE